MAIDSAVTDCVTALKGGSNAYNANGGMLAGTWTQPGYTLTTADIPAHTHGNAGSHTHDVTRISGPTGGGINTIAAVDADVTTTVATSL
jgi:microcystin-dependent protein